MESLIKLAAWTGLSLLAGFAAVVVFKCVTGVVSFEGLLESKDRSGVRSFSPGRLQLLFITIGVALRYLQMVVAHPDAASLPQVSDEVVATLGGSQALYLGGKAVSTWVLPLLRGQR
jgi:hypothetical protein